MSAIYGNDTYSVRSQEPLIVNFDTSYTGNVHDYLVMYLDASAHKGKLRSWGGEWLEELERAFICYPYLKLQLHLYISCPCDILFKVALNTITLPCDMDF